MKMKQVMIMTTNMTIEVMTAAVFLSALSSTLFVAPSTTRSVLVAVAFFVNYNIIIL